MGIQLSENWSLKKSRPSERTWPSFTTWNHQSRWNWTTYVRTAGLYSRYSTSRGFQAFYSGNSNISTGGDSIDMTDQMGESYKQLATTTWHAQWGLGLRCRFDYPRYISGNQQRKNRTALVSNSTLTQLCTCTYTFAGPGQSITPKVLRKLFAEI